MTLLLRVQIENVSKNIANSFALIELPSRAIILSSESYFETLRNTIDTICHFSSDIIDISSIKHHEYSKVGSSQSFQGKVEP
jgi:hypothetical protein